MPDKNRIMPLEIREILIPTDFSKSSRMAVDYGIQIALKFSSKIHLLNVIQPLPPLAGDFPVTSPELLVGGSPLHQSQPPLGSLSDEMVKLGIPVVTHCREGFAFDEILLLSKEQKVDLIIMGTHGLTGLSHVLLGSVAEKIVRNAPCPVLTVRHPDFTSK